MTESEMQAARRGLDYEDQIALWVEVLNGCTKENSTVLKKHPWATVEWDRVKSEIDTRPKDVVIDIPAEITMRSIELQSIYSVAPEDEPDFEQEVDQADLSDKPNRRKERAPDQMNDHFSVKKVSKARAREILGEQEIPVWLSPSRDDPEDLHVWLARPTTLGAYEFMQNDDAFWKLLAGRYPISRGQWEVVRTSRGEVIFSPEHLNNFIVTLGSENFDPWEVTSTKSVEGRTEEKRYKIIRQHYHDSVEDRVLATGLTLKEAQAHCKDKETSSKSATTPEARAYTAKYGPWFGGYADEREP